MLLSFLTSLVLAQAYNILWQQGWKSPVRYIFVVQSLSSVRLQLHGLPQTTLPCPSLSPSLLKFTSTELVALSTHLILCCSISTFPFILPQHQGFSNELALGIRCQGTGASTSASVLPMNIQDWFPYGLTGVISLQSKGPSRVFSRTTIWYQNLISPRCL